MPLNKNILLINVESKSEVIEIEKIAKSKKKIVNIGIRLNPNTDAKTINSNFYWKKRMINLVLLKKLLLNY